MRANTHSHLPCLNCSEDFPPRTCLLKNLVNQSSKRLELFSTFLLSPRQRRMSCISNMQPSDITYLYSTHERVLCWAKCIITTSKALHENYLKSQWDSNIRACSFLSVDALPETHRDQVAREMNTCCMGVTELFKNQGCLQRCIAFQELLKIHRNKIHFPHNFSLSLFF